MAAVLRAGVLIAGGPMPGGWPHRRQVDDVQTEAARTVAARTGGGHTGAGPMANVLPMAGG